MGDVQESEVDPSQDYYRPPPRPLSIWRSETGLKMMAEYLRRIAHRPRTLEMILLLWGGPKTLQEIQNHVRFVQGESGHETRGIVFGMQLNGIIDFVEPLQKASLLWLADDNIKLIIRTAMEMIEHHHKLELFHMRVCMVCLEREYELQLVPKT